MKQNNRLSTQDITQIGLMTAAIAVLAQISIPMPKRSSGTLLGVKQKSRPFYYIIDSYTTSEYLPPGSY